MPPLFVLQDDAEDSMPGTHPWAPAVSQQISSPVTSAPASRSEPRGVPSPPSASGGGFEAAGWDPSPQHRRIGPGCRADLRRRIDWLKRSATAFRCGVSTPDGRCTMAAAPVTAIVSGAGSETRWSQPSMVAQRCSGSR